nr:hypothetical protein [Tanacetum cinerariifolium]
DGVYLGQCQMQEMNQSIIQRSSCNETIEEHQEHVKRHVACRRGDESDGCHGEGPKRHSNDAMRVEAPFALDVKYSSKDATDCETGICRDEN